MREGNQTLPRPKPLIQDSFHIELQRLEARIKKTEILELFIGTRMLSLQHQPFPHKSVCNVLMISSYYGSLLKHLLPRTTQAKQTTATITSTKAPPPDAAAINFNGRLPDKENNNK